MSGFKNGVGSAIEQFTRHPSGFGRQRPAMPVLQAPHITAQLLVDALCGLIKGQMGGLSIARALQHQPLHDMTNYITMKPVMRRRAEGYLNRNGSQDIFTANNGKP